VTKQKNQKKRGKKAENRPKPFSVFCNKYWPYFAVGLITAISGVLRFYGLRDHLHFDLDEATHIRTIVDIYEKKTMVLRGPSASAGTDLYHGAYYYYIYLIPTLFAKGNPMGPAIFTAILSLMSVPILFGALTKRYSMSLALIATSLYALSSSAIAYSRWAWNPNLIPFFFILAIFSLERLTRGKQWWLIGFAFSLSSISQLHIGAAFYIIIFFLMVPLLLGFTRKIWIWLFSFVGLVLPWLTTIIFEAKNHFSIITNFSNMLSKSGSQIPFWAHISRAWNYYVDMFGTILHLPPIIFVVSLLCLLGSVVFKIQWRSRESRLLPIFIALSLIFSFCSSAWYSGLFFTHYAEELFVIMPIITALFLKIFFEKKELTFAGIVVLAICLFNNWNAYKKEVVYGKMSYGTQKKICKIIKDKDLSNVEIWINGKANPAYIRYTCEKVYAVRFGNANNFTVETDFNQRFSYAISTK